MFKNIIFTALGITLTIYPIGLYAESQEELESKCAVVITSRINDNQDPYQYALDRIRMCKKNDILSVSSFLDTLTTKVYFNDMMRGFCAFDKQIIADVNKDSSSLSCVHVGKERLRRDFKKSASLRPKYDVGKRPYRDSQNWNSNPTPLKEPGPSGTRP